MTGSVAAQSSRRVGGSVRRSYDLWLVHRKIKIKCDWFGENDGLRRNQWTHCGYERVGFCLAIGWECKL